MHGIRVSFGNFLTLVLGQRRELLSQQLIYEWNGNFPPVAHVQFTRKSVTSICSTLQELKCDGLSDNQIAFLLRHFPKLQKAPDCTTVSAVCVLHNQQQGPPITIRQVMVDGAYPVIQGTTEKRPSRVAKATCWQQLKELEHWVRRRRITVRRPSIRPISFAICCQADPE